VKQGHDRAVAPLRNAGGHNDAYSEYRGGLPVLEIVRSMRRLCTKEMSSITGCGEWVSQKQSVRLLPSEHGEVVRKE
jgi:hypothetical protein